MGITLGTFYAFLLTALVVITIPGPSVLFIVSRALASGRRVAMWTMLGNVVGVYGLVIPVAFGMGTIAEHSLALFTVMKLVGGTYLIHLGIKTFLERGNLVSMVKQQVAVSNSDRRAFGDGVLVGVANPKAIVFMASVLPQFVTPRAGNVATQILLLGLFFCVVAIVSDSTWAMAAGAACKWFARSSRRLEMIGGGGGLAIAAVGITLLVLKR